LRKKCGGAKMRSYTKLYDVYGEEKLCVILDGRLSKYKLVSQANLLAKKQKATRFQIYREHDGKAITPKIEVYDVNKN
jgi:hypothetical protein